MKTFKEWIKLKETEVVMGHPCKTPKMPDAQVLGDPAASCRSMKKKSRKKKHKANFAS